MKYDIRYRIGQILFILGICPTVEVFDNHSTHQTLIGMGYFRKKHKLAYFDGDWAFRFPIKSTDHNKQIYNRKFGRKCDKIK